MDQNCRACVPQSGTLWLNWERKNEKIVVIDAETAVATNIMPFKNEFPEDF